MILAVRYSASIPWHAFPGALIGLGGYNGPYNQESHYADNEKTVAMFSKASVDSLICLNSSSTVYITSYDSDFFFS